MEITNYITTDFKPIDSQETIAAVRDFLGDLNFSHFPIVEEGVYIGSISAEDVETFEEQKKVADERLTQIKYLNADFDNYRKRLEKEKQNIVVHK